MNEYMIITVRAKDTFWYYSELYKIPLNLLMDSNRNINPANIRVGMNVRIPGYRIQLYTVRQGETLWQIAQQKGLAIDTILLLNPNINPNVLRSGQQIRIPQRVVSPIVQGKSRKS